MLRREIALDAREVPDDAVDGRRLSAAETGRVSGLFFAEGDGFAALAPEEALPFSAERTAALLAAAPLPSPGPRLVTGVAVRAAALVEGGAPPQPGARCRVRFDGVDGAFEALVEAVDENAVLLRLTEGLAYLGRVRFVEGTIADA